MVNAGLALQLRGERLHVQVVLLQVFDAASIFLVNKTELSDWIWTGTRKYNVHGSLRFRIYNS